MLHCSFSMFFHVWSIIHFGLSFIQFGFPWSISDTLWHQAENLLVGPGTSADDGASKGWCGEAFLMFLEASMFAGTSHDKSLYSNHKIFQRFLDLITLADLLVASKISNDRKNVHRSKAFANSGRFKIYSRIFASSGLPVLDWFSLRILAVPHATKAHVHRSEVSLGLAPNHPLSH